MASFSEHAQQIDVNYVAHLARLQLSAEEASDMERQLGQILEYVRQLEALDVREVEPTSHAVPVANVLRPDVERPGLSLEEVLRNAPRQHDRQFLVPKIVE